MYRLQPHRFKLKISLGIRVLKDQVKIMNKLLEVLLIQWNLIMKRTLSVNVSKLTVDSKVRLERTELIKVMKT